MWRSACHHTVAFPPCLFVLLGKALVCLSPSLDIEENLGTRHAAKKPVLTSLQTCWRSGPRPACVRETFWRSHVGTWWLRIPWRYNRFKISCTQPSLFHLVLLDFWSNIFWHKMNGTTCLGNAKSSSTAINSFLVLLLQGTVRVCNSRAAWNKHRYSLEMN